MPMSDYLESILLNQVLNGAAYSQPSTVYVALYTVAPTDAGGGTEVSQVSGGLNYVRQSMTGGSAWTVTGTATRANNTAAITFPVAGDTWGTVVAVGIFDSATIGAGNLLFWGTLTSPRGPIQLNDQVSFPIDTLAVTLT